MEYGSFQNLVQGNGRAEWTKPEIGQGATKIGWTDRDPYTVVRVSKSGKRCWVQEDNYRRTDGLGMTDCGQEYEFTPNPDAPEVELRWTGKRWAHGSATYIVGHREKYHDFSF